MASIRPLKTGWQVRWYDKTRTPHRTTTFLPKDRFPRKRDAEKEKQRLEGLYAYTDEFDPWHQDYPGAPEATGGMGLADAVDRYTDEKREAGKRGERGGWSENTYKGTAPNLEAFARKSIGNDDLHSLTKEHTRAHIYREDVAHRTKRTYFGMVRAFLRWCERKGYARPGFADDVLPPQPEKRHRFPQYVTLEEVRAICRVHRETAKESYDGTPENLRSSSTEWYCDLFMFRFWLGHRPSEAMEQRRGGVDLERWLMAVGDRQYVPKNKREGIIYIPEPARDLVANLCEDKKPSDRLFGRTHFDKPRRAFKEAAKKVVPYKVDQGLDFYNLRHSCGVYWRRRGVSAETIGERLLRHESPESTKIYAQIEPEAAGEEFDRVTARQELGSSG